MSFIFEKILAEKIIQNISFFKELKNDKELSSWREIFKFFLNNNMIIKNDKEYYINDNVVISNFMCKKIQNLLQSCNEINTITRKDIDNILDKNITIRTMTGIGSRDTPRDVLDTMTNLMYELHKDGWILRSGGASGADDAFEKGILNYTGKIEEDYAEIFIPWNNFLGDDKNYPKKSSQGYIVNEIPKQLLYSISTALKIGYYGDGVFSENAINGIMKTLEKISEAEANFLNKNLISKINDIIPFVTNEKYKCYLRQLDLVIKYHPKPNFLKVGGLNLMARNSLQILGKDLKTPTDIVICYTNMGTGKGGTGQALRIAQDNNIPIIDLGSLEYKNASINEIKFFMETLLNKNSLSFH
jgi:hypothetical protein